MEELMQSLDEILDFLDKHNLVKRVGPTEIFEVHPHASQDAQCEVEYKGKRLYLALSDPDL